MGELKRPLCCEKIHSLKIYVSCEHIIKSKELHDYVVREGRLNKVRSTTAPRNEDVLRGFKRKSDKDQIAKMDLKCMLEFKSNDDGTHRIEAEITKKCGWKDVDMNAEESKKSWVYLP